MHLYKNDLELVGQPIGSTGYGLMGLTWRASPPPQEQAFLAMRTALDCGANFWDGGEIYGNADRNSLHLLKEYFTKYPKDAEKVVVSIKGGAERGTLKPNGGPGNTRRSIEECLKLLDGKKKLDIWEPARVDHKTPIEITMREADKFVKSGQLGGIGLSECSANSIRRAASVTNIAAVEVEFSLWEMTILENGVAKTCAELGIPIIAYSPLGRGFLTGQIKTPEDIPDNDHRKPIPRFQGENFYKNLELVTKLEKLSGKKGCKPGQLAIAWVKAQGSKPGMPLIIPIPGASTCERVKENMVDVELSQYDLEEIDNLLAGFKAQGDRYHAKAMPELFGDSPELNEG
ncbi:Aldo/keto reductase [Lojkania enalia]|uniref:Aldo/keto reductase n=1 Tax=Lojkania enalia TaxID=147567 RepID=A0A9P4N549_9PLEO|nr:Aldo/keto reductase [Didymosphaeria enalia]